MKKNVLIIFTIILILSNQVFSQTTVCDTLYITPDKGKDAYVNSFSGYVNTNFGDSEEFEAQAWTSGGVAFVVRSFIDFDFNNIPVNATIISASLFLFHKPGQSHSTASGSNACFLERIITPWQESTVTWNNQPSSTNVNYAVIPASTTGTQDFPNIDVTNLVIDIHNDLSNSYGIAIKLQTEAYYRQMYFSSGDSPDVNKRPFVVICYSIPSDIDKQDVSDMDNLFVYPNPTKGKITLECEGMERVEVIDIAGKLVYELVVSSDVLDIDISSFSKGVYFVKVSSEDGVGVERIVLE